MVPGSGPSETIQHDLDLRLATSSSLVLQRESLSWSHARAWTAGRYNKQTLSYDSVSRENSSRSGLHLDSWGSNIRVNSEAIARSFHTRKRAYSCSSENTLRSGTQRLREEAPA